MLNTEYPSAVHHPEHAWTAPNPSYFDTGLYRETSTGGYYGPSNTNSTILGARSYTQEPVSFASNDAFPALNDDGADGVGGFRFGFSSARRRQNNDQNREDNGGYHSAHHFLGSTTGEHPQGLHGHHYHSGFERRPTQASGNPEDRMHSQRILSSADVRPDMYRFKFMHSGIEDLKTCRDIFENWSKELEKSVVHKYCVFGVTIYLFLCSLPGQLLEGRAIWKNK